MQTLLAPANLPFTIALAIVLLLGAIEVLGLLVGGASSAIGIEAPDVDMDADADGVFGNVLDWLHVGQIPATILGIVFLLSFGVAGLGLQSVLKSSFGTMMPLLPAVGVALAVALPATRLAGGVLKRVLPRDETEAVSRDSFLGCEAQITIGTARRGHPAEARLRDRYGRSHYVMVEPDQDDETFAAGSQVLILKRHGDIFRVMDNRGSAMAEIESGVLERTDSQATTYGSQQGARE